MDFREQMSDTPAEAVDPRYARARDAAIRSFFHRFGRAPTEDEFRQSIGHFLPADLQRGAIAADVDRDAPGEHRDQAGSTTRAVDPNAVALSAATWLLQQRTGRPPTPEEVEKLMQEYVRLPNRAVPVAISEEPPTIARHSPPLQAPPFERAPLFPSASSFYERSLLPVLRRPNCFLPLDHAPEKRSVGGSKG